MPDAGEAPVEESLTDCAEDGNDVFDCRGNVGSFFTAPATELDLQCQPYPLGDAD